MMSANDYYNTGSAHAQSGYNSHRHADDGAPSLPPLQYSALSMDGHHHPGSPASPSYDSTPLYKPPSSPESDRRYYGAGGGGSAYTSSEYFASGAAEGHSKPKRQYSDEIPLRDHPQQDVGRKTPSPEVAYAQEEGRTAPANREQRSRRRERTPEKKKSFWARTTWVVYIMTLIQCSVFIAELVRNSILTSSPIEIHPQFNPMIGPSFYVLVNMGARYVPCMKGVNGTTVDENNHPLQRSIDWPCPNLTSTTPNTPGYYSCSLNEFCGFQSTGGIPNQWYRFIVPIFLHAGFIHLGFNMLLQLTLGREMEQIIGSVRFLVVYLSSGIFGFVLGGNFAAQGLASTGASGALFGLIAINLLDLLYTWNERVSPKKELAFIILDIVVSFVLGLLPGLDNFSHIGGFLMGLVLGVCLLHSPNLLRGERVRSRPVSVSENPANKQRRRRAKRVSYKTFLKDPIGFFKDRKLLWWSWWLVRVGALIGVLAAFIVLLNNFYKYQHTCGWCKYLTCIDVNSWCDQGKLPKANESTQSNPASRRDLLGQPLTDLSSFF